MRGLVATVSFAFLASNAFAEPCQMVGGCVGNIWYMHVPKEQLKAESIFRKPSLPNVNAIETISKDVSLLMSDTFVRPPYPERLQKDLALAVKRGEALTGWGWGLRAGSKIRILSYQTFPQLGDMSSELFALVLV